MGKQKEEIKDPLKLLLPEVIYDYFELVHTESTDEDVHLFLDLRPFSPNFFTAPPTFVGDPVFTVCVNRILRVMLA